MNIRNILHNASFIVPGSDNVYESVFFTYEQEDEQFITEFFPNEKGGFFISTIWHRCILDFDEDGRPDWGHFDVTSNFKRSEMLKIAKYLARSKVVKEELEECFGVKVNPNKIYVEYEESDESDEFEENTYIIPSQEIEIYEQANYEEWRQNGYTNPLLIDREKNEELWRKAIFQPLLDFLNTDAYYKRKTEKEKSYIMDSMMYMGDNYTDGELFLYKNYWSRRYITINKWGVVTFKERRWAHVEKFEKEGNEGI